MPLFQLFGSVTCVTTRVTDVTHHRNCSTPINVISNSFLMLNSLVLSEKVKKRYKGCSFVHFSCTSDGIDFFNTQTPIFNSLHMKAWNLMLTPLFFDPVADPLKLLNVMVSDIGLGLEIFT